MAVCYVVALQNVTDKSLLIIDELGRGTKYVRN